MKYELGIEIEGKVDSTMVDEKEEHKEVLEQEIKIEKIEQEAEVEELPRQEIKIKENTIATKVVEKEQSKEPHSKRSRLKKRYERGSQRNQHQPMLS